MSTEAVAIVGAAVGLLGLLEMLVPLLLFISSEVAEVRCEGPSAPASSPPRPQEMELSRFSGQVTAKACSSAR